jgi:aspartate racemase
MVKKTLGIVGGLDSETATKFLLKINDLVKKKTNEQPHIILDNIPIPKKDEESIIKGNLNTNHKRLVQESLDRLVKAGANVIAIPCNTVHSFFDELKCNIPLLNIIDITLDSTRGEKIGLLGTSTTINQNLFQNKTNKTIITLGKKDQHLLDKCIIQIINSKKPKGLEKISAKLKKKGAESIILGCTTLHNTLTSAIHVDSLTQLAKKAIAVMEE